MELKELEGFTKFVIDLTDGFVSLERELPDSVIEKYKKEGLNLSGEWFNSYLKDETVEKILKLLDIDEIIETSKSDLF